MAAVSGSSISMQSRPRLLQPSLATTRISTLKFVSLPNQGRTLKFVSLPNQGRSGLSLRLRPLQHRFRVSCAAKPETVEKVCKIVRKQLALPDEAPITGESKFVELGADSLDTVEIVMGLEEEFDISVEEDSAQSITTVQNAADLIEKLIEKK